MIVDVMTSPDLTSRCPHHGTDWKSHQFDVKLEDHIKAMPAAGSIFVMQTNKSGKGSVYFDKIGFMVR